MWKRLASKELFSHPRLTLIEDLVELPNGMETTYLRYKDTGNAVTILCRNEEGKFLLQREYSYPPNQILNQLPGGSIGLDEDPQEGANRELMEEAKLYAHSLRPLGEYLMDNRRYSARMFLFLATNLETRVLSEDPEEVFEHRWISEFEMDELVLKGEVLNVHTLSTWLFYKLKKETLG